MTIKEPGKPGFTPEEVEALHYGIRFLPLEVLQVLQVFYGDGMKHHGDDIYKVRPLR